MPHQQVTQRQFNPDDSALRDAFNRELCDFIDASPTPFHAAAELARQLERAGFVALDEATQWSLQAGGRYYVTRNQSSIIAWVHADQSSTVGLRMLGAHTDSPALKVKPQPDLYDHHSWRLGVEIYGGALLNPWFDRDLSLAGRVHFVDQQGALATALVNVKSPIATIPSLAIHLDREANKKRSVNAQTHMPVLLASGDKDQLATLTDLLMQQLQGGGVKVQSILDHELYFYDTQRSQCIGVNDDFIAAARLDNLLSCFVGCQSLINSAEVAQGTLLICSDHEEVGSASAAGAAGPFLQQVLQRILPSAEDYARAISQSMLISTDNAHGLHPNYADKMDSNHGPRLNGGPVIKVNANQRYASNSETQAYFRNLCQRCDVPVQTFVVRSDLACGSTIGPITASEIGIKTLDIGVPTYAMHSIRELAGSRDPIMLAKALEQFLQRAA